MPPIPSRPGRPVAAAAVAPEEIEYTAVRAQGPGGQNVNKVATAVQLRYDIAGSSLPAGVKARLLALGDQRITRQGVVVIKAQTERTQELNRARALERLRQLVAQVWAEPVPRRATKPTYGSRLRRLEGKSQRAEVKATRGKVRE